MHLGRWLILGSAIIAGLVTCGVAIFIAARHGGDPIGFGLVATVSLAGALLGAALSLPVTLALESDLKRLTGELNAIIDDGAQSELQLRGVLSPLRRKIQAALGRLTADIDEARTHEREIDIQRKVIEAEREHAEAVLHSLQDAVIVTDIYNELKMANEHAASLLGFEIGDSMHKPIDSIIQDDALRKSIREACDSGLAAHRRHVDFEMDSEGGDASARKFDVTLACLPDARRDVGGVVTILRDVTMEREISQMKSDFVSKVSHELRTPLSSINAYVEMLIDGEAADDESRQEFYGVIKNEADRLSRLIDNMLNISRIEAGIIKIDRTEVDFLAVAQNAVEVIVPQAKLKEISVHTNLSPLACTAMADSDMMHQVILNLLSNAVKYTPEGGRVTLTVENDDATGSVLVSVADTGLGIPPDALPRIFDKFYRIENYKRVAKGTGLGLALVKHLVETVHHGSIQATSELGLGSKFFFTIPYDSEAVGGGER